MIRHYASKKKLLSALLFNFLTSMHCNGVLSLKGEIISKVEKGCTPSKQIILYNIKADAFQQQAFISMKSVDNKVLMCKTIKSMN